MCNWLCSDYDDAASSANRQTLSGLQSCVKTIATPAIKTYHYIKDNFGTLVKNIISWAVIITCVGLLYGFSATAEPLAIGIGCGMGFGALLGLISWKLLEKTSHDLANYPDSNTLWKNINGLMSQSVGTSGILATIVVTVIFAALAIFPFEVGIMMGVIMGSHEIILWVLHRKSTSPETRENSVIRRPLEQQVAQLEARVKELEKALHPHGSTTPHPHASPSRP